MLAIENCTISLWKLTWFSIQLRSLMLQPEVSVVPVDVYTELVCTL